MLILQNGSYTLPTGDRLFDDIQLTLHKHDKVALIGNNGSGKSTLLKIIAGEIPLQSGLLKKESESYYIPQVVGQFDDLTLAGALQIDQKLQAFHAILSGDASEENLEILNDDWTIEDRCREALNYWKLDELDLNQSMKSLSGGQKTKVFLAGILIHQPELVLMDEPSNHLDVASRQLLFDFIASTSKTLLIVSHDRKLLNLLDKICVLDKRGITAYGGNYEFYREQRNIEQKALSQEVSSMEKTLRKAKEKERETMERQQKLDSRGKKKQEKAGVPTIMLNTLRNNAEKSTSKLKNAHADKIGGISKDLHELRRSLPDLEKMKFGFDSSHLHQGKVLVKADRLNYAYSDSMLWKESRNFQINSGERIAIKGANGSGKTTLIRLILGNAEPTEGTIFRVINQSVYIDQDYSLINNQFNVYEQAGEFNQTALLEHEVKTRLNYFLFDKNDWDKPCAVLSGGERMRLILCCLTLGVKAPDLIVLDEPTNNLDLESIEILTSAVQAYEGTVLLVSHDESFLEQINIQRVLQV
ncbi:ABC-F family ATP-binding cassette domain-containing protein [Fluviicola sp.]|uniref:ABC-F family ATP-binding cassette domain-containing protein n=1 Tax=Fluviicola sp. TaxID=1917219 RepID=UPI00262BF3DE|nr:ABC-F family ATP-binding cassette domain-containing protein [Fluviicola sp.]